MTLDDLDRKIIQYLSAGTSSYQELARTCNVTRNTIYRRIAALEKEGTIKNTLHCIVNLEQMDLVPVSIGVRIHQSNQDKAINLLTTNGNVRFLWRTYGEYNLILVAFCPKGKEGEVIQEIEAALEALKAEHICVSVGYVWEKMSYSPFDIQTEFESKITRDDKNRF